MLSDKLILKWDFLSESEWNIHLLRAGKSSLVQSWAFGEAKKYTENWNVKRCVIYKNSDVLAIFQILTKKMLSFNVSRLNRGPLWVKQDLDIDEVTEVFRLIRKEFAIWKFKFLFFAPNLISTDVNLKLLNSSGFRNWKRNKWHSGWIDLSLSDDELRKKLNSKWRNQLNVASRTLNFRVSFSMHDFNFLMDKYQQLMLSKEFKGVSIRLIRTLYQMDVNNSIIFNFVAYIDEETIASILVARHGNACTYLVGWNGDEGRKFHANNLLLWQAVLVMKNSGCLWFDIGGLDEVNTPGITKFKRGMNIEEYILVGEFI